MSVLDLLRIRWLRFSMEKSGEINLVAMVLIIVVVIALVAIFRTQMTDIVNDMFDKIRTNMELTE